MLKSYRFSLSFLFLVLLISSSGCEILFWSSLDPAGLPCRKASEDDPRECLSGYTCVNNLCQIAGAKKVGDNCVEDAECGDTMVCRDHYDNSDNACKNHEFDLICNSGDSSLADVTSGGKKCRTKCNPNQSWAKNCANGEICYIDAKTESGFCQAGNCGTDAACGNNAICVYQNLNPAPNNESGKGSGLCFQSCDPFSCNNSSCSDCPSNDDLNDDKSPDLMNCAPFDSSFSRLACTAAGTNQSGANCISNEDCIAGNFCDTGLGQCTRFCRLSGGNPACNAGATCTQDNNILIPDLGFCK